MKCKTKKYNAGGAVKKAPPKPMKKPQQAIDDKMMMERVKSQNKMESEEVKSVSKMKPVKKMKRGGKCK